ncbi:polyphosphate kinase 1 [Trichlorobacter lovleyi]|uniref:polyphosphate kinase 1 n=2 Tax=Trichlorobacter lovleyi TaxID=313985 RepID=UPI0023F245EC|nr:polyphosphate kinase 1 [Trichlorobacter lovleyi]
MTAARKLGKHKGKKMDQVHQGGEAAPVKKAAQPRRRAVKAVPQVDKELNELPDIQVFDLDDSQWYLNRELTWLAFNRRVMSEASDPRTPLLERVKFLAIVGANLDEFFMKRIGGLKQQLAAGVQELTIDGRTPRQQLQECHVQVRTLVTDKAVLYRQLVHLLDEKGIEVVGWKDLTSREQKALRELYARDIYPLLTPQSIDPAHPFPFVSNLSLNLLVTVRYPREKDVSMARVKVPLGSGVARFMRVGKGERFVPLEEVMAANLDMLFPGMKVVSCELFRVTRNANTEKDEEKADDLVAMIESELQERRFAPIVRLEVVPGMDPVHKGRLAAELDLDEASDVFEVSEMLGMRDLFEIACLNHPKLHDPPHHPEDHPQLMSSRNIFHIIRNSGDFLVKHPYQSFASSVERFLNEAADDPKVCAIKMTLYRTSKEGRLIESLVRAAENGKQVAVVVELKARFDEAANLRIAERMEEAGIHVTYGVVGLKTHCKVILVVRRDYNGIRRYVHIGTGNYHTDTARLYSDLGLFTSDDAIGQDLTELFNYLTTGLSPKRTYKKLLPAPKLLKRSLLEKIEREITLHQEKGGGLIQFKMNALDDGDIVKSLYRACQAGVRVDLYVRDSCRFRPGVPGLSDTAKVVSIVGRFLEHSRLYYFRNGGQEEYFIGSADAMKRNLESRVEILVPVESLALQQQLRELLDAHVADQRYAWEMQPDGSYLQRQPASGQEQSGLHQLLIAQANQSAREAQRLKRRVTKLLSN